MAHGIHGVAVAYADLFEYTHVDNYMDTALRFLLSDVKEEILQNKSWCNGLGGILLSHADVLYRGNAKFSNYKKVKQQFHDFLNQFMNTEKKNNICLCHGSSGELEILNELVYSYSNILSSREIVEINERLEAMTKFLPETNGKHLGISLGLPLDTFMLGSSGVAYTQLRTICPDYPSLILLNSLKV